MIAQADAVKIPFPDQSFHTVVTSPPYWGLREYTGEQGDEPLGLESTPERHVERIVEVFREVRRVLRDDGVVWMNYGDCYSTTPAGNPGYVWADGRTRYGSKKGERQKPFNVTAVAQGNLMMMPHRVALALQADGWIIRQDLVWYKRNPMPESVGGWKFQEGKLRRGSWRHTRAHEYVFMATKKMQYWSNQEAVRETTGGEEQWAGSFEDNGSIVQEDDNREGKSTRRFGVGGRNPRSVLDVPTAPYKGAHYATFPPNLIAPLIRATCPRWACPVCGQGWAAVVEHSNMVIDRSDRANNSGNRRDTSGNMVEPASSSVLGYRPTCEHPHTQEEAVPGIVFDPFVGSGTTIAVAKQLLRRGVGIDISLEYLDKQAKVRAGLGSPSDVLDDLPLFK